MYIDTNKIDILFLQVLQPGGHVSKTSQQHVPLLAHSRYSVDFADRYAELRTLLEARSRLQLVRDYTSRLNAAAMFGADVEQCARDEYSTWRQIVENALTAPPTTKLECLSAVCDDLRLHMNHWHSIRTRVHTDPYLRGQLPGLSRQLNVVHRKLVHIRDRTLFWIGRLIEVGFRVLAHCDTAHLTQEMLWAITRGLEDYNTIATEISPEIAPTKQRLSPLSVIGNVKPVPFLHILNLLASERAKYAAAMTHQFFSASDEFLALVLRTRLPDYTWGEDVIRPGARTNSGAQLGSAAGSTSDTSDYHTGSQVSLSTAMLRVGTITAPDLSRHMSPIVDFTRREQEFAGKFFHIVCASTSLLKKSSVLPSTAQPSIPTPRTKRVSLRYQNHPKPDSTPPPASTLKSRSDNDVLMPLKTDKEPRKTQSTPNSSRKSVSWGDSAEVGIIQQLTYKYLDLMWEYFGAQLGDFFVAPVHGGVDSTAGQLGNIRLCKDIVSILIVRMIQQTCLKGT